MGTIKRAVLYVTRKKGKSILLFFIFLVMATFVLTSFTIWKASETAQLDLRQSLGGRFDIFVDWENSPYVCKENVSEEYDEETGKFSTSFLMYSTEQFTLENIAAIKEIEGVKYCSARFDTIAPVDELSLFPGTFPVDSKYRGHTKVVGVYGTEDDALFTSGALSLSDGRHITSKDHYVAVISRDAAEKSELKIGDYITLHSYDTEGRSYTGKAIRIQIIGLFTSDVIEQFGETVTTYDKIQNRVFVDLQSSLEMDGSNINYGFSEINVTIDDPQNMEQIISNVRSLSSIDWNAFTVEENNEIYENAAAALLTLKELVVTLMIVIIIVSVIILTLILTLWTKTRIHEIGIFLSVGIMKSAIIGQYLMEVLLIAAFAFGLSYFTSNAVAEQVGNQLLEQSMRTAAEDDDAVAVAVSVSGDDVLAKALPYKSGIYISVGLDNLVWLYLIGFIIIIIAVGTSSVTVMRLKPREILSKMN